MKTGMMKSMLFAGVLGCSFMAFAGMNPLAVKIDQGQKLSVVSEEEQDDSTPAERIGAVTARYRVVKNFLVEKDGKFDFDREVVCEIRREIGVYSASHEKQYVPYDEQSEVSCPTKYRGRDIRVNAHAAVMISMFDDEEGGPVKGLIGGAFLRLANDWDDLDVVTKSWSLFSGSRDLNQKSFIASAANASSMITCWKEGPDQPEYDPATQGQAALFSKASTQSSGCKVVNPETFYVTIEVGE